MIVYGTINGNINTHSLEIRSTGRITGDIKTQVLQVETGGTHNGKLSMSTGVTESKHKQAKPELVNA
jgi:cytoskeletal protein CcmA (bactofilin family)